MNVGRASHEVLRGLYRKLAGKSRKNGDVGGKRFPPRVCSLLEGIPILCIKQSIVRTTPVVLGEIIADGRGKVKEKVSVYGEKRIPPVS